MSKTTVKINQIKSKLDSISGLDGLYVQDELDEIKKYVENKVSKIEKYADESYKNGTVFENDNKLKEHNLVVSKRDFESIMRIFGENNIKLTDKEQDRVIKILNDNNISYHSKADEMFEELGYAKQKNKKYIRYYMKYGLFIPDSIIEFNLYNKWVNVNFNLDMQELQAINEKCKELGWIK